jgi:hypothetical protein
MARVTTIQAAKKDQGVCGRCGDPIHAGDGYRHFTPGFRSRNKQVRCMKPACTPRPSELTNSKLSEAYAAQEDAQATIGQAATMDDITSALEDAAGRAREVAEEYESAVQAAPMLEDQVRESIDALETWADELDNPNFDEFEPKCAECGEDITETDEEVYVHEDQDTDNDHDAEPDEQYREEWFDGVKDAANELIDSLAV